VGSATCRWMAARRERRDPVMTRQSYGAGARTTSTSCASTPGCTTRTPARSADGSGSSPVRRSQLQRRPARREAPQQTADRRGGRGFFVRGAGVWHMPCATMRRAGLGGSVICHVSAFSPGGCMFSVCTSSVNEYEKRPRGGDRGLEFKASAGWRHTAHTSMLGSTRETTLARICRQEPRHAVHRSSGSARGAEGRGRWERCGEAPSFRPSALALAQDPVSG